MTSKDICKSCRNSVSRGIKTPVEGCLLICVETNFRPSEKNLKQLVNENNPVHIKKILSNEKIVLSFEDFIYLSNNGLDNYIKRKNVVNAFHDSVKDIVGVSPEWIAWLFGNFAYDVNEYPELSKLILQSAMVYARQNVINEFIERGVVLTEDELEDALDRTDDGDIFKEMMSYYIELNVPPVIILKYAMKNAMWSLPSSAIQDAVWKKVIKNIEILLDNPAEQISSTFKELVSKKHYYVSTMPNYDSD